MKLIELLTDKLLNTTLMEMAVERKTAINRIESYEKVLNEHLIKYLTFNDSAERHWLVGIRDKIFEIDNLYLKPKSSKFDKKVYFRILFEDYYGHGTNVLEKNIKWQITGDYSKVQRSELSILQIYWALKQFHLWICPLISSDHFDGDRNKMLDEISNKLQELKSKAKILN